MSGYFKWSKFFLFLAPFSVIFITRSTLFPFIVGKYVFFRSIVDIALILFLLGLLLRPAEAKHLFKSRTQKLIKSPLVIAVTAFTTAFLLSALFSYDPGASFWSNFERGEGGLQLLHLYAFFILISLLFNKKEDWKKLFTVSIVAALIVMAYGAMSSLKYIDVELDGGGSIIGGGKWYNTFSPFIGPPPGGRFQGTLGNPAYVNALLLFIIFYTLYLISQAKSLSNKLLLGGVTGLSFIFFWLAQTRGAFLGLVAGLIAFLAYLTVFLKSRWKGAVIILLITLLLGGTAMIFFRDSSVVQRLPGNRFLDINIHERTAQTRFWTWNSAFQGWKERPIFGWGPENFPIVFDKYFNEKHFVPGANSETWFDRAHSVFFDYLAETGVVGLLSYLSIFAVFYWLLLKNSFKSGFGNLFENVNNPKFIGALMFSIPAAYLVQGLFLFDVLPIYINLFIFLAFANYLFGFGNQNAEKVV